MQHLKLSHNESKMMTQCAAALSLEQQTSLRLHTPMLMLA